MGIGRDFHKLWVKYENLKQDFAGVESKLEMAERVIGWNKTTIGDLQDQMNREVRTRTEAINKDAAINAGLVDTIEKLREQVAFQLAEIKRLNTWIDVQFGEGDPEIDNPIKSSDAPEPDVTFDPQPE